MKTKNIGYAYATSDIAKHMGFNATGCYFVAVYDDSKPMTAKDVVFASNDKESVLVEADMHVYPVGKYSMNLVQA